MNKYETVFIANPNLEEEGIKALIEKFSALINENGKVEKVDEVGLKKLAYEINKNTDGYYVVVDFEAKPEFISELERVYRITDGIMKFITIRKDEE